MDDFTICYCSKNIHITEGKLHQWINMINKWATNNGFKISKSMQFCKRTKLQNDPRHLLEGTESLVVECLGIIFDMKLSFIPHLRIEYKILQYLAHANWEADWKTLGIIQDTNPIKIKSQKFCVPISKEIVSENSQPNLLWRFGSCSRSILNISSKKPICWSKQNSPKF